MLVRPLLHYSTSEGRWNIVTLLLEVVIIVSMAVMWKTTTPLKTRVIQPWYLNLTKYSTPGQHNREERSTAANLNDGASSLTVVTWGVYFNTISCLVQACLWPTPIVTEYNLSGYLYAGLALHNAFVSGQSIAILVMANMYVLGDLAKEYPRFVNDTAANYTHVYLLNKKCQVDIQVLKKTDDFRYASVSWTHFMYKASCCFDEPTELGPKHLVSCFRSGAFYASRPLPCCKQHTLPGMREATFTNIVSCLRQSKPNKHIVNESCVDKLEEFVKQQTETILPMATLSLSLHGALFVYGVIRLVRSWRRHAVERRTRREELKEMQNLQFKHSGSSIACTYDRAIQQQQQAATATAAVAAVAAAAAAASKTSIM